jgi:hypothetical protein
MLVRLREDIYSTENVSKGFVEVPFVIEFCQKNFIGKPHGNL